MTGKQILDYLFQSTLSVRRATLSRCWCIQSCLYFNPRSPWGERRGGQLLLSSCPYFNPRSPWGERPFFPKLSAFYLTFQSTLSVRRATEYDEQANTWLLISIHALREESDTYLQYASQNVYLFQSTLSVRRATLKSCVYSMSNKDFNPRSPWGERPAYLGDMSLEEYISIHALREESDFIK